VTTGTGPTASSRTAGRNASEKRLFAIVLAAGGSRRFRSSKQLVTYDGAPLVTRAVRLAESICGPRSVLVSGHRWRPVVDACRPLQGFFVNNTRHRTGMGGSIACGVRSVTGAADAVLLLLADQPLITASHLEQLVTAWIQSPAEIAATSFAETAGPPVIFPRRYFTRLSELQGDRGAREILTSAGSPVRTVKLEEAAVDIDEPEDIDRLP
jgi:CTP:molybdopterin cytidylyltransferase MocA